MRVVLDTNVLVRGHGRASGPARKLVTLLTNDPHVLILSPFILTEVERVLNYPRLQLLWPLSQAEIQDFVQLLDQNAEVVYPQLATPETAISKDPDDDPIIQAAVLGSAQVLCTLDRHFWDPNVQAYCNNRRITILKDVELLRLLESKEDQSINGE